MAPVTKVIDTMIGYKVAKHDNARVIVTLQIPKEAQTNMGRTSVAVKETAKYRTNKAKVLEITDSGGKQYDSAVSNHYAKSLTYKVGETIEEPSYNQDPEMICAEGIHFFLSRHVAEMFGLEREDIKNGIMRIWYNNGQLAVEEFLANSKPHGRCRSWSYDGKLTSDVIVENDAVVVPPSNTHRTKTHHAFMIVTSAFVIGAITGVVGYRQLTGMKH